MIIRTKKFLFYFLTSVFFLTFSNHLLAQDKAEGEKVFSSYCTSCHKLGEVLIGPNLVGVKSRWPDAKKLHEYVKNPSKFIDGGDPYVAKLVQQANGARMTVPPLTDKQIDDVLAYVDAGGGAAPATASAGGGGATSAAPAAAPAEGLFGMPYAVSVTLLLVLLGLLIIVIFVLSKVRGRLKDMTEEHAPAAPAHHEEPKQNWLARQWAMSNKTMLVLSALGLVVLILFIGLYKRAQDLGTQIGYAPEQPIKFNHKIHAGQYGINCEYCHTGVEKAKNASIPSLSTCMNCHDYIKEGPQYGKTEIAKLVNAYNNKIPVKWVRIHNLPDFVYFNHAQHVKAGKLDCANCHGRVAEMERVTQVSTLEMGWCVNCHREKAVDTSNPYYTATFDFIKKHKKYTIGQLGGLECSKCHY